MPAVPAPVIHLLSTTRRGIDSLLTQLAIHQDLLRAIRESLPAALSPHCLAVSLRGHRLTLFTDAGVWATRLHYFTPTLIDILTYVGSFGLFFTFFLLFCRFLPILAISEVKGVMPEANPHNGHGNGHGHGDADKATSEAH